MPIHILITPRRPTTSARFIGEVHLSMDSYEGIFNRLTHAMGNQLPKDAWVRCARHSVASVDEANNFLRDYLGEYWVCWCDRDYPE